MSEFMTIGDRIRRVPPALFDEPNPREAIARWAANPDAVEAELASRATIAAVDDREPATAAAVRIQQQAATHEARIREADQAPAAPEATPASRSRRAAPTTPTTEE